MVIAYPINKDGERIGEDRKFPDAYWERLSRLPNLRFIEVKPKKSKSKEDE